MNEEYHKSTSENSKERAPQILAAISLRKNCTGHFIEESGEGIIASFTIILAFSTIFLWVATVSLVKSAEKTAERQLRAYVGIETVMLSQCSIGQKTKVTVVSKNYGQTPAYRIRRWGEFVIATSYPKRSEITNKEKTGKSTLDPGAAITTVAEKDVALTAEEFADIYSGSKKLYFIGRITYRDAFLVKRRTNMLYEMHPPFQAGTASVVVANAGNKQT